MKYNHRYGVKKARSRTWLSIPVIGLVAGCYLLINTLAPAAPAVFTPPDAVVKKLVDTQSELRENRLYLPKINVDVAVVPIDGNEKAALEKGAIHRAPQSGNPKTGGNFVIAAHRFNIGLTPAGTRAKSPFYHLDKIAIGDDIYVDYDGVRYAYKVIETKSVRPDAIEIEHYTEDPRLTLYTCELAGPKAGRDVVIAEPQGEVVWGAGAPKLRSL